MDEFDQSPTEDGPDFQKAAPADTKRRKPTLTERLAATLCQLTTTDPETGARIPVIDPDWARAHTAQEIVDRFEKWHRWDHRVPLGLDGTNHPANIDPLPRQVHEAIKTPRDLGNIARARQLSRDQAEFRQRLLAKHQGADPPPPKRKPAWKPLPGTKASGWKHRMSGDWERRTKT